MIDVTGSLQIQNKIYQAVCKSCCICARSLDMNLSYLVDCLFHFYCTKF